MFTMSRMDVFCRRSSTHADSVASFSVHTKLAESKGPLLFQSYGTTKLLVPNADNSHHSTSGACSTVGRFSGYAGRCIYYEKASFVKWWTRNVMYTPIAIWPIEYN